MARRMTQRITLCSALLPLLPFVTLGCLEPAPLGVIDPPPVDDAGAASHEPEEIEIDLPFGALQALPLASMGEPEGVDVEPIDPEEEALYTAVSAAVSRIYEPARSRMLASRGRAAPTVKMTIYSSRKVIDRNARIGERMVARYAARAFARAGYNYEIVYNLPAQSPPDEVAVCSSGRSFGWWSRKVRDGNIPVRRKDANVLITDAPGGGCGAVGGMAGTTAGRYINEERPHVWMGEDLWHRNIHGNLHEIGHQLGASHDHDRSRPGNQHIGYAYVRGGKFYRTPNVAGSNGPNWCGTMIDGQRGASIVRMQYFCPCALRHFRIR